MRVSFEINTTYYYDRRLWPRLFNRQGRLQTCIALSPAVYGKRSWRKGKKTISYIVIASAFPPTPGIFAATHPPRKHASVSLGYRLYDEASDSHLLHRIFFLLRFLYFVFYHTFLFNVPAAYVSSFYFIYLPTSSPFFSLVSMHIFPPSVFLACRTKRISFGPLCISFW
ncbi:hypothetical protein F4782DRAFT_61540 [Xylaria castorea]|nr:hypothetical protein F4782DRAFT_61540 [Xylaria castorea]